MSEAVSQIIGWARELVQVWEPEELELPSEIGRIYDCYIAEITENCGAIKLSGNDA